ncbi:MAG: cytochrome c, partial [Prochlorococcaceae cyanobacterium]
MTGSPPASPAANPSPAAPAPTRQGLITGLVVMAAAACIVLLVLVLQSARSDPYSRETLQLLGSRDTGERLFL